MQRIELELKCPCGRCRACRLNYELSWTIRLFNEFETNEEYGDKNLLPHYHLVVYGVSFDDWLDIRKVGQMQCFLEVNQRSGYRLVEWTKAHFGVTVLF